MANLNDLLKLLGKAGQNIQQNVTHPQNIVNNLANDVQTAGHVVNQVIHPQLLLPQVPNNLVKARFQIMPMINTATGLGNGTSLQTPHFENDNLGPIQPVINGQNQNLYLPPNLNQMYQYQHPADQPITYPTGVGGFQGDYHVNTSPALQRAVIKQIPNGPQPLRPRSYQI